MYLTTFLMLYLTSFRANSGRAFGANRLVFKEGSDLDEARKASDQVDGTTGKEAAINAGIDELSLYDQRTLLRAALDQAANPARISVAGHLYDQFAGRGSGSDPLNGQAPLFKFQEDGKFTGLDPDAIRILVNRASKIDPDMPHAASNDSGWYQSPYYDAM